MNFIQHVDGKENTQSLAIYFKHSYLLLLRLDYMLIQDLYRTIIKISTCRIKMPHKNKALARSGKKGKALRKQNPPLLTSESGGEEDEPSVRDMLCTMTEMMTSLDMRLGTVE